MLWRFDGSGEWEAFSAVGDQSGFPVWRIQVCDDGTFDVNQSDPGLLHGKCTTWLTLKIAMAYCESGEATRVAVAASKQDHALAKHDRRAAKCLDCRDALTGHEDESATHCRWCVTSQRIQEADLENKMMNGCD